MNRAEALNYITAEYAALVTETGITSTDNSSGFKNSIDSALRQLGYSEAELSTADETNLVSNYMALLDYYALRRFSRALATKINYSAASQSYQEQQLFTNVNTMLSEAKEIVQNLGYSVDGSTTFELAHISLDFIEPSNV